MSKCRQPGCTRYSSTNYGLCNGHFQAGYVNNSRRKDWVCWKNTPLDFNDNDITFVIKAAKRIEQILIHHYDIKVQNKLHSSFTQIINQAKQKSSYLSRMQWNIQRFKVIRNKLVHTGDFDELSREKRKQLNSVCMGIFGMLEKECNCEELFEGEKLLGYKKYNTITLSDDEMYLDSKVARLFLNAVAPSSLLARERAWITPESLGYKIQSHMHFAESCADNDQSYLNPEKELTRLLINFIQDDSDLRDAWKEYSSQSATRAVSTNTIVQPDYIVIVEGFGTLVVNIGYGIVKLFMISMSILMVLSMFQHFKT